METRRLFESVLVRFRCRHIAVILTVFGWLITSQAAWADRSAGQGTPGLALEKAGKYAEAAIYYHRALRGFQELWVRFWHYDDLSKAAPECRQLITEYQDRLKTCMDKSKMDDAGRRHMEFVNELWMSEYVDQEQGEYKLAFARKAEEAEKHGDFLLATQLRSAAADYCKLVAMPYHEQLAARLDKQARGKEADLHRKMVEQYKQQAAAQARLSAGDKALADLPGLQGPATPPEPKLMADHCFKSYIAYHQRVLSVPGDKWLTGKEPKDVAAILKQSGPKHVNADARFASATVLASLGEGETSAAGNTHEKPIWRELYKGHGEIKPGLTRIGPDGKAVLDPVIDFGTWWKSGERSIQGLPNPLRAYPADVIIKWRGHLAVTQPEEYRFYVRNHGQESGDAFNWKGGSETGVLHFTTTSAKLRIDGKEVLPVTGEFVDDPKAHMRIDYSQPIKLEAGLHAIELDLAANCRDAAPFKGQGPSARLYWSSDAMLRQLVPPQNLISVQEPRN